LGNVRASQDLQALPRGSRKITALHESAFGTKPDIGPDQNLRPIVDHFLLVEVLGFPPDAIVNDDEAGAVCVPPNAVGRQRIDPPFAVWS
jgi:hypothetical protein